MWQGMYDAHLLKKLTVENIALRILILVYTFP